jgi:hypothetical protein
MDDINAYALPIRVSMLTFKAIPEVAEVVTAAMRNKIKTILNQENLSALVF